MVFQTWKSGIMEKEKRKAILLLVYIADVSCLTNRPFYMRQCVFNQNFYIYNKHH